MAGDATRRCPPDLRELAVRLITEVRDQHESDWAAMAAGAEVLEVSATETLRIEEVDGNAVEAVEGLGGIGDAWIGAGFITSR